MNMNGIYEKTIIIIKPDGVQRGLVGEVLKRFEMKGLKLVGLKMAQLNPDHLREHYAHLVEKPFYPGLEQFMMQNPVVIACLEGKGSVGAVRLVSGITNAGAADGGTIRGDLAMGMCNVIHCSDTVENAALEVTRFFGEDEIFDYDKTDYLHVYMDDERS
ncbi:MAG: nucleoside-diphosphate kinase [Candidatus Magasanikbacteria bacterium CG10_big_fil_rev_8_21_14_0_10_43_6]|uniref:nucleoside-diphosphate kinase n=1 Tax=Candidatus Magasanikbacteria bacterium CG10_big_fil_rev_8_21_14_0_10_43_6 TaxID=1974650 RepID=A0A2M6W0M9_9BACT|nr:MAG: nucleoside-diphosphate kinase [Candidatus Magasanikbacteria bacterium CG10_big_fil_rev_8_21_14_0_10_43_6]